MVNITYLGGNVVDWNTEIDKTQIGRLARIEKNRFGVEIAFIPTNDQLFEIQSGASSIYLYLYSGQRNLFDKNAEDPSVWEIKGQAPQGAKLMGPFDSLRRPGGGPTNNAHVAGTLAGSLGSKVSLELLVLDESMLVQNTLNSELSGCGFTYDYIRPFSRELNNVNFR